MAAKSLAASLSVAARDFGSLLTSSKTRPVSRFIEAPMIDNSISMMADLYRGAGVGSLQGLEASVKANFYEAQVRDAWEELLDVQAAWDDFLTKVDCEDEAGLVEGALAPLKSPLVNARTGLPTNLGQVLEEMDVGQHKCLHLVLLRFFG